MLDNLHKMGISMSYPTIWTHLEDVAKRIRESTYRAFSEGHAVIFAWDNINWHRHISQSRIDNQGEIINATTRTLIIPRYVNLGLKRTPQKNVSELRAIDILPTIEDHTALFERRVIYVARFMIEILPALQHLKDKIPDHWKSRPPQKTEKTQIFPMAMLYLNEGTITDTIKIFDRTAAELKLEEQGKRAILCAGDQSSCRNARGAKSRRRCEAEAGDWVSGLQWLLEWPQHFHCQLAYLKVITVIITFLILRL
jgi:hypothetical protein